MFQKLQNLLQRLSPHSKILVVAIFSVIFLILIFATVSTRISKEENKTFNPIPTPRALEPGRDYAEGQIKAKFKEGFTDAEINRRLEVYNASIKSTIPGINVKVISVPVGQEEIIKNRLIDEGIVEYAEFDAIGVVQASFNDPDFPKQYGLNNTGQNIKGQAGAPGSDVRVQEAWDTTRGEGVKVGIVDTGIELSHPDVGSKVIASKAFGSSSVDDKFGHGTHVAGIVTANTNNGQGISGTCPGCQLLIVKALGDNGRGTSSDFESGMVWLADNGAQVINASIVFNQRLQSMEDAVGYAWGKGAVVVAAAGNCGDSNYSSNNCTTQNQVLYPAGFSQTVSVAALDNKGRRPSFSNHGTWIKIAAPGKDIYSTLPTDSHVYQNNGVSLNYDFLSGTSMASPMVAGVAGLIWSTPHGTSNQAVVDRLLSTADQIDGTGSQWKNGRVNAAAAVKGPSPTVSPSPTVGPSVTVSPSASPSPSLTVSPSVPVVTQDPSVTRSPTVSEPPPFVCGGSPDSICTSPTVTVVPDPINDLECLDPRGTTEKINDWVNRFILKVKNYINAVMGNPQQPPPPPVPCILQ
jgi:thermitase